MKTGLVIRAAETNYRTRNITGALIIAFPNGVHRVWQDEWPKDWSEDVPHMLIAWRSGKMATLAATAELDALLRFPGMAVLTMNCEALLTKLAWNYIARFLRARRTMVVADESSWSSSPSAARTKRLLAIGRHPNAVMKRILDGTPVDESPLNLWAPCAFLDPALLGYPSFYAFRNRYAKMEDGYAHGGRTFRKVTGYQNLDELREKLSKFSTRLRRADISDAPPKTYDTRYFTMTPRQRQTYDRLRDEYLATVGGADVPVAHVLTRLIRLQMVARNYYPPEDRGALCQPCNGTGHADHLATEECERCLGFGYVVERTRLERIDPDASPALDALAEELCLAPGPVVVWCKFRQDVTDALDLCHSLARPAARYDGTVPSDERESSYHAFRDGGVDTIVGTIESGLSRGKDLRRASTLIYYSNSYSLRSRRQSEDRAEGIFNDASTSIVDLVAEDTNDLAIITALREKRSLAELVMGDNPQKWI